MSNKAQRRFANWLFVFGAAPCSPGATSIQRAPQKRRSPVIAAGEIGSRLPDFSVKGIPRP